MQLELTNECKGLLRQGKAAWLALGILVLSVPCLSQAGTLESDIGEPTSYPFSTSISDSHSPSLTSTKLSLAAAMGARSVTDDLTDSRQAGAALRFSLVKNLLDDVDGSIIAGTRLYAGNSRALFSSEFDSGSYMFVDQALLDWRIVKEGHISAGIIVQRDDVFGSPLLLGGSGFPGLQEEYTILGDQFKITLMGEQTIPTSQNLSTRAVQADSTPWFLYEKAVIDVKATSDLRLLASMGHFAYGPLPSNVASDSKLLGNTVNGTGPQSADFAYDYEGYEVSVKSEYSLLKNLNWELEGSQLKNLRAPSGNNQGQYVRNAFSFFTAKTKWEPELGFFRNESDSSPAYYNSKWMGHNNREGYFVGGNVDLPGLNQGRINISGRYGREDVIRVTPLQADRNFFEVELEAVYALL